MLKNIINKAIDIYLNEQESFETIKLYHRLSNKINLNLTDFIRNVVNNGLIRKDNGEIGNVIWFSNEYNDYAKNGNFVVAIDYNKLNKEKYKIHFDGHNAYAYEDIPFQNLEVIKMPTLIYRNVTSSDDLIRLINKNMITPEKLNGLQNVKVFADVFDRYVQPFININDFINKLSRDKITLINIF